MGKLLSTILCCLMAISMSAFAQKANITVLTTEFSIENKFKQLALLAENSSLNFNYYYVEQLEGNTDFIQHADFIIVDAPRPDDQAAIVGRLKDSLQKVSAPLVQIQRMTPQQPLQYRNLAFEHAKAIQDYYLSGMENNRRALLSYIEHYLQGADLSLVEKPQPLPDGGIYHPHAGDKIFTTLEDYLAWWQQQQKSDWQEKPVIAMETTSSYISDAQTAHLDALIDAIEHNNGLPIVYYPKSRSMSGQPRPPRMPDSTPATEEVQTTVDLPNPKAYRRPVATEPLLQLNNQMIANVLLVNTFLGGDTEGRKAKYQQLNIPVVQILHYRSDNYAAYKADSAGVDSFSLPFTLTNAEYIGIQDPVILTTNEGGEMLPIPEQLNVLVNKAFNLASLQRKDNQDKKLALLFWNHPPGETNQGASNLNVPRSLEKLTSDLQKEGYQVSPVAEQTIIDAVAAMLKPSYRPDHLDELMDTALWSFLPLEAYQAWFKTLPEEVQSEINGYWGEANNYAGLVAYRGQQGFVIPRLESGNLIIMPQPSRGGNDPSQDKDIFHDVKVPMHHYYAAVYLWIREHYQADAIIHFGTHGSQEWLPGKERGLWAYDAPNLAVGSVPVIYPYIVDNIAEAIHVKRRGRGVIISHQTAPLSPAGLSDDFVTINNLLEEYQLLDEGLVKQNNQALIIEQVVKMNIHQDLEWDVANLHTDFAAFSRELENYLEDLGAAIQPLGLHTFGQSAESDHLTLTLMLMLQEPLATALGLDNLAAEFKRDYKDLKETSAYQFVAQHIVQGTALDKDATPEQQALVKEGLNQLNNLAAHVETDSLMTALAARWIDPSYGGDPVRNPDALPTGRNMYGFDPSRVPTKAAYTAGIQALDELLLSHQLTEKETPSKLAFTMWSTETMRHLGMLEAQIFAALGVKPVWDRGGRVVDLELIPLSELGRPRIDTVISLTGLYRDQFPNLIERFNQAIVMVAEQDEPAAMNPIRANTRQVLQRLLELGYPEDQAHNLALTRVFGTESGDYGTQLPEATLASDKWEADDNQLAELYLSRMSWAYGPDPSQWSQKPAAINGQVLNLYAEQLKGTQAAVFSRSSNLRGLLDTDHPFEYLGGISLAVQHLDGAAPQLYIANLRDPNRAKLQSAERFLANELRAVYQHPNWLAEMQKEGYAGTLELLNTINNFWGWQVMDERMARDDQWEEFHQTYIKDKYDLSLKEWFEQSNPAAMAQIAERMLEAVRKDYWDASEQTKQELVELYQELAAQHDIYTSNETFKAYVAELAAGYGLAGVAPAVAEAAAHPEPTDPVEAETSNSPLEQVKGQEMAEIAPAEPVETDLYWLWALCILIGLGAAYQAMLARRQRIFIGE
ncbi:MAG: cobaltochelatase subunit CobN [Pseudomonas sp.]|nr:cobaltochelatase subunit CobN [Pseudomonas sp.]